MRTPTPQHPDRPTPDAVGVHVRHLSEAAPSVFIDGHEISPVKRAQVTYVPPLCDITDTTVAAAITHLTALAETVALHPGDWTQITSTLDRIDAWALTHGHHHLVELSGTTASRLIENLAGVDDLQFRRSPRRIEPGPRTTTSDDVAAARDTAHLVRNTLTALRIAATVPNYRPYKQRLMEHHHDIGLPHLPPRHDQKSRAATDDEILLMRLSCLLDFYEGAPADSLAARVLVECGIPLTHATTLTRGSLDNDTIPTRVRVPAHRGRTVYDPLDDRMLPAPDRDLPLVDFAEQMMPRVLRLMPRHDDTPLVCAGSTQPGNAGATANLSGQLGRHLRRAGLADPDLTPRSMTRWRAKHALTNGAPFKDALLYFGGNSRNLMTNLGLERLPNATDRSSVYLTETYDNPRVFKIPKKDYNRDRSLTLKRQNTPAARSWNLATSEEITHHTTHDRDVIVTRRTSKPELREEMKVSAYHSSNLSDPDVHHDHSDCPTGQQIPTRNKVSGTGGFPRCEQCVAKG